MSNRNGVWSLPAQYQAIADQDWTMAPGAPTGVSASAGNAQAEVSFTAPTFAGIPGTITQFKVTSSSGQTATGSASPITVTGLTNGNAVTFTAQAQNAIGLGKASDASSSVTPLAEVISGLFSTFLYTGTGSSAQTITNNIDLTKGGLVWVKHRSLSASHILTDSERGVQYLRSDTTDGQINQSLITNFVSTGFTANGDSQNYANDNGEDYVSWTFGKQPKFFDVVTYTGTGVNRTISHDLGSTPGMIIVKRTDTTSDWAVYHRGANSGTNPATKFIRLNLDNAESGNAGYWNNTEPTDSVFSVGSNAATNSNGGTYVAYLFAHNNSDGGFGLDQDADIIKCGYYTGNGSASGPTVTLGFEPQWLMIKRTDTGGAGYNWFIFDAMRGMPVGGADQYLSANLSDAEAGSSERFKITPTGFQLASTSGSFNASGGTYIYMAIRRPDMSTPTSASDVFAVDTRNSTGDGNEPGYRSTFPVDMVVLRKDMTQNGGETHVINRLTGNKYLKTYDNNSESSDSAYVLDYMNGFNSDTSTKTDRIAWMWKRARGYFDVVAYTGTGSARTISHNLGAVPEMMWVKRRSGTRSWFVYHSALGNTGRIKLDTTDAGATGYGDWNSTTPTSSVFSVGSGTNTNGNGETYIAYLFATVAGVSKVGSYTGDGSTSKNIDCGFTNSAKFVMIRRTDAGGGWIVWDTTRGLSTAAADPYLYFDSQAAETQNASFDVDPYSAGFNIGGDAGYINASGGSYIFYAIAA